MHFLTVAHHHPTRLDAAVRTNDDGVTALPSGVSIRIFTCMGKLPAKWYDSWFHPLSLA